MSDATLTYDDDLAAEYALGVLSGDERAEIQRRMTQDYDFARLVSEWEHRLSDLNNEFEAVNVPRFAKAAIDQRIFGEDTSEVIGLFDRFRFLIAGGFAFALTIALFFASPTFNPLTISDPNIYVATLTSDETDYRFVFNISEMNKIDLVSETGTLPSDKDYELWLITGSGDVISLGVTSAVEDGQDLNRNNLSISEDAQFAISLEPKGGSPTGVATGPIIALGPIKKI